MLEELQVAMRESRALAQRDDDPQRPSRVWTETEVVDGTPRKALVVILRTRGCTWAIKGGCTMCGYVNDSFVKKIAADDLVAQFRHALTQFDGHEVIKLYTSGSFLDKTEVPIEAQQGIVDLVPPGLVRFQSEAQAHHVTAERLADLRARLPAATQLCFGIGLESGSDDVLEYSVNNEFTFADFERACGVAAAHGTTLKAYVLVKPLFLTESEAIEECVETARRVHALAGVEAVSFNPISIHANTLTEQVWQRRQYRPPWLWSIVEVLRQVTPFSRVHVKSDVVAGGLERGAHNCGRCDDAVLRAIDAHKVTQDVGVFDGLDCPCRAEWEELREMERFLWCAGAPPRLEVLR